MPTLHIHLLGPPEIYIGERPCKVRSKKAEALLAYCLLYSPAPQRVLTRRHLCDMFWPKETEEVRARKHLSDTLWLLKRDLQQAGADESQCACLRGTRDNVAFNATCDYVCDVEAFTRLVLAMTDETSLETLEWAYGLYRGPFLEVCDIPDVHPEFETWVSERQGILAAHYQQLLHHLSIRYMARGAWPLALHSLKRLQRATPEDHAVYSLLMINYAVTGQITQAEQIYRQYVEVMNAAGHLPPDPAVAKLHQLIGTHPFVPQQAQPLVEETLRTQRAHMDAPLKETLSALWKALALAEAPSPSAAYTKVWRGAQTIAKRHGCSIVGTPHVFLALCTTEYDTTEDAQTLEDLREALHPRALDEIVQACQWVLGEATLDDMTRPLSTLELQRVLQRGMFGIRVKTGHNAVRPRG